LYSARKMHEEVCWCAAENYDQSGQQKVSSELLKEMVKYIDQQHSEGRSVTSRRVLNWLRQEQGVNMSRRTIQRKLQDLGPSWSKVKPQKRTLVVGSFRLKAIRDYLISLDKYVCAIENGKGYFLKMVLVAANAAFHTNGRSALLQVSPRKSWVR
jgi:hypothetical protein